VPCFFYLIIVGRGDGSAFSVLLLACFRDFFECVVTVEQHARLEVVSRIYASRTWVKAFGALSQRG
ncbi:hypothetical protein CSUI_007211, partial [Cystoisospora suis]